MIEIDSRNAAQTFELGRRLGERLAAGDAICLAGDLGAGKTLFAQGIAAGLGLEEQVTSPTFTILQLYETGRWPVYHFDLYRLEDVAGLYDIGFDEYANGDGVAIIEWADKFAAAMPEDCLWVTLRLGAEEGTRRISLRATGPKSRRLYEEMKHSADIGA